MNITDIAKLSPVFAAWIKANNDHDLQGILSCYAPRVTMFATFEDYMATPAEREQYFINFLSNPDMAAKVDSFVIESDGDTQIIHGDYTFSHRKGGIMNFVPARYSMIIRDGKITHHHSSQLAGTKHAEQECKMQILETVADQNFGGLTMRAGFCNLQSATDDDFGIVGHAFGRFTIVSKNGQEIFRHISPEPNSVAGQKIHETALRKVA